MILNKNKNKYFKMMENNLNENFPIQDPNLSQGQNITIQNNIPPNQIPNEIGNYGQIQNEQLYMPPPSINNNDIQINANNQNINTINDNPEYMPIIPKPYVNGDNTGTPQVNPEFNNIQQNNIPYNQPYVNQPYMNQPNMIPQYQQAYPNQMQQGHQDNCNNGLIVFLIVFFCCCCCCIGPGFIIPLVLR